VPAGDLIDVLIKILAAIAPVVGGLAIWAVAKYVRLIHVEKDLTAERQAREAAEARLTETRDMHEAARKVLVAENDKLRARFNEARDKFYRIKALCLALQQQQAVDDEAPDPKAVEAELNAARQQLAELEARVAEVARFDGRLWLRPPTRPVPAFRPLAERKTTIVSVLNLKGGVGKTTITANLAATVATAARPALMLDLDYQRSLSMLLVADADRKLLHRGGMSVQHFLRNERHALADLLKMKHDLGAAAPHCAVIANSDSAGAADSLEETETRLMAEWLFDPTKPDVRFFLREALHDPALGAHFGYVFLDCPPRLTTACVNALAASDFVLIPVIPDPVSTHAVENLLRTLDRLRPVVVPDLAVLGIVPNMVKWIKGGPRSDQAEALNELRAVLTGRAEAVPITTAVIQTDVAYGKAAAALDAAETGALRLAVSDPDVKKQFQALARELGKEIDRHARRRTPPVPDQSPAGARSGG
jgi:cellulose biosynthesis protein BcsQ